MSRVIWLLLIALVVYIFGSAAWQTGQKALKPQHQTHSDI